MNYRHIYHAGNFADVLKHAVLTRIITYLKNKDKAFRVIDTHAGPGIYKLSAAQAEKTGEWRTGVERLMNCRFPEDVNALLQPYLGVVKSLNTRGDLDCYPGSPKLTRLLLRKQDRLSAVELHPEDCSKLRSEFDGDFQTRVIALDGWLALVGHVPPKEKRGLVLIDPPFEKDGEFDRIVDGIARAHRRWPSGIYCAWYPLKAGTQVRTFHDKLQALGFGSILCAEMTVVDPDEATGLAGSGLIIVNPPYTLQGELELLLPALHTCLSQSPRSKYRMFWISEDR